MTSWKRTLHAALFAQVCSITGFMFVLPFLPRYIRQLGVPEGSVEWWTGLVGAGPALPMVVFAPIWGAVADRFGRRLMVMRAMFGGAVVLSLMAFVRSPTELLICRMLQGATTGTVTANMALVASVTPRERSGYALGMMQMSVFVGASLGPLFGGMLADLLGYRGPFLVSGLLLMSAGLVVKFRTEERFTPSTGPRRGKGSFRQVFAASGFLAAVLALVLLRFSGSLAGPSFPLFVETFYGPGAGVDSVTGAIISVGAVVAAVSAGLLGRLSDAVGARKVLVAFSLLGAVAAILHALARSLGDLFVLRAFLGLASAGMIPAANAIIRQSTHDENVGKAYGVTASLRAIGWGLGMLAGGWLATGGRYRLPFILMGVSLALTAAMVVWRIKPRDEGGE